MWPAACRASPPRRRAGSPPWNNTTVVRRAEFPAVARELKQKPGQDIVQYGYGPVTAVLLREGLLDELRIWLHPVTVGGPARAALLAETSSDARFRLVDHRAFDSGMVILSYQPRPTA
ncbi:dihydrofolate reductase family protein [Actinoplanes sp. NPDC051513]|uniref:dihydrofolate reductase family protein n=1 Tax=Actinoplanes sp. NPDC051513 TaxID=3363908 RepID=UPI003795D854